VPASCFSCDKRPTSGRRGRYSRNFATDVLQCCRPYVTTDSQSGPGRFAERDVQSSAETGKRRSELGGCGGGRMNWIVCGLDSVLLSPRWRVPARYCWPAAKQCGGNSEDICLHAKLRDTVARSRNFENDLPVLNRFGMECRGRDFGQTGRAYRPYARDIRCYDEDAIRGARWAEFCHSRFEFSLGRKPRELARTKGTESQRGPWQRGATKRAGGLRRAWVTRHNLKPKPYSTRSQSATRTQAVESKTQIGCRVVLAAKSSSTQLRSRKPFYWPMFLFEILERVEGNVGGIALERLRPHASRLRLREPGYSIAQVLRRPIQPH
jgi:hypothetical protein